MCAGLYSNVLDMLKTRPAATVSGGMFAAWKREGLFFVWDEQADSCREYGGFFLTLHFRVNQDYFGPFVTPTTIENRRF